MTKRSLIQAAVLALTLASGTALAVERPQRVITLFNTTNIQVFIAGIDITTHTGMEAIGVTDLITSNLPVSNPNKRKSLLEVRLKVMRASNGSYLGSVVPYVGTKSYPDPITSPNTGYYCEEDGGVINVDPTQEGFPCDFEGNFGIANSGSTRYLVAGLAMFAWYEDETDGTVDIGQASVTVFDPASFSKIWRKTWKNEDGDWELEDNLSAVGDFRSDDGDDEVRIVYSRDLPNHEVEMKYTYYDIATGDKIKQHTFKVAAP